MLVKVTCNNCGDVAVFEKDYLTTNRKKCFDCYICRNSNKEHNDRKKFLKNNNDKVYDNFDVNKYFGRHKGFTFENIKEDKYYS